MVREFKGSKVQGFKGSRDRILVGSLQLAVGKQKSKSFKVTGLYNYMWLSELRNNLA
jgi:hypothetical protein